MAKPRKLKAKSAARRQRPAAPRGPRGTRRNATALGPENCERFLLHEARLLDEARFDDWLAFFTPDGWDWGPSEPEQGNPHDTVSLIYDDRRLLETRVRRLASPRIYSQEPRSRTSRIIANILIENSHVDTCTVRSKFVMIEYRRESQRLFAGTAFHHLGQAHRGIRIAWERGDLGNRGAAAGG